MCGGGVVVCGGVWWGVEVVWRCVVMCGGGVVVCGGVWRWCSDVWRWCSGVWRCVVVCGGGVWSRVGGGPRTPPSGAGWGCHGAGCPSGRSALEGGGPSHPHPQSYGKREGIRKSSSSSSRK